MTKTELLFDVARQAIVEYLNARKCLHVGLDDKNQPCLEHIEEGLQWYIAERYATHEAHFKETKLKSLTPRVMAAWEILNEFQNS